MRINNHNTIASMQNELNQFLKLGRPIVPLAQAFLGSLNNYDRCETDKPIRILDEEDGYEVFASIPGFSKKEVSIKLETDLLLIAAEQTEGKSPSFFNDSSCNHSVNLPEGLELEKAKATLSNGILTVSFPKCRKAKPKEIKIA